MEVRVLHPSDPYRADWVAARLRLGKTQRQVAREADVSYSAYQKYELGLRNPRRPARARLLRALGLAAEAPPERPGLM